MAFVKNNLAHRGADDSTSSGDLVGGGDNNVKLCCKQRVGKTSKYAKSPGMGKL